MRCRRRSGGGSGREDVEHEPAGSREDAACTRKKQDRRLYRGVAGMTRDEREKVREGEESRNDPGVAVALSTVPLVGIKPGVGAVGVLASSSVPDYPPLPLPPLPPPLSSS